MKTDTFNLFLDIVFLLFFLLGTLWTWGKIRFPSELQATLTKIFEGRRTRFRWLFLLGLIALTGLFIWKNLISGSM